MEPVRHKLAVWRHEQALVRLANNTESYAAACRNAIKLVIKYHRSCIAGNGIESARSAAESAARSAARLARSAESAARSAARLARSAESAAWSAAWSVAESAESAARSAEWSAAESAESVEWSAESVEWSAESAARSAEWSAWSAWSAAESAARNHYASEAAMLIALLRAEGDAAWSAEAAEHDLDMRDAIHFLAQSENQNTMIITLTTYNSPAGTRGQPSGASHTFYAADWRYDPTQQPPCLHIINTSGGESVIAVPFDDFRVDGEPTRIKGKEVQP
jgi:hypothetical protein